MRTPAIKIDCAKLAYNAKYLNDFYLYKGMGVVAVLKGTSGDVIIAQTILEQGITLFGDTNVQNLKRYKDISQEIECMMMRSPALSEIEDVIKYADISLNSEIEVISALSNVAIKQDKIHNIILMIELGDLREGIVPENLIPFITNIINLKNINILGIGSNFACFNNNLPSDGAMERLSNLANQIEETFNIKLKWISGGNSTIYDWVLNTENTYRINQVRLGESILCGMNPLENKAIPELYQDSFKLLIEVIESKQKGKQVLLNNYLKRLILNIGKQDTSVTGLTPNSKVEIVNFSSNHMAAITKDDSIKIGSILEFGMDYLSMMTSMTSPNVYKYYLSNEIKES